MMLSFFIYICLCTVHARANKRHGEVLTTMLQIISKLVLYFNIESFELTPPFSNLIVYYQ